MRRDVDRTYPASGLRKYDKEKISGSRAAASRYLEVTPFCWMCPRTTGQATPTKEHIFPQWSFKHFTEEQLRFEPFRLSIAMGVETDKRGPMPARTMVESRVCNVCNNGWMSRLEAAVEPLIFERDRNLNRGDVELLSRWFAKTSAVLNVSQTAPLKWKAEDRHRIALGMPSNIVVSAFRVPDSDLNWVQGFSSGLLFPEGFDPRLSQGLLSMIHICNIQIRDIVGTVVKYPWQLAHSEIVLPGVPLWTREGPMPVDLDLLPLEKDIHTGFVTGEWKDSPLLGRPTIDSVDFFEA
ncbi:hypothetical protein [Rhodococcus sp. JVH1]|uniref:hypothetical protein n=1 Tax=Rhodococcus sp. JVH1 TaxID=745408 RepID=UPI0005C247DC|nr:hypothetical protein [Rhodococcus sp. JVH1]